MRCGGVLASQGPDGGGASASMRSIRRSFGVEGAIAPSFPPVLNPSSKRREIEADVCCRGALGQAADRDVIDAGGRDGGDGLEVDAARGFAGDAACDQRDGFAQGVGAHVVEQEAGGACLQGGFDLVEGVDFADHVAHASGQRAGDGRADAAGDEDMVVLDHRCVPQAHAVVVAAAHAHGVFFEVAEAGDGLAGIEQAGLRLAHGIDIGAGEGGYAREVLHGVERGAFGGEHGAGIAGQAHERGARFDAGAFGHEDLDLHRRVERTEEGGGDGKSADADGVAAVHHPGKAGLRRDHAFAGDIVPAARKAQPEVFLERDFHEGGKVKTRNAQIGHAGTFTQAGA